MKFDIKDIQKGDEVIFYSTEQQSNYDEYWTVLGKSGNQIMIGLKKHHLDVNWTLDVKEIVGHLPLSKL